MTLKKFLWISLGCLVIIIGIFTFTYIQSLKPIKSAEEKAVKTALAETRMETADAFHLYHGLESVSVVEGKNIQGEKLIVWIPENGEKLVTRKAKNGITKKEAIQKVLQFSNPKKIIDVRLGMEKGIPLWEIYYQSKSNLINYYYVDFETGEWLKRIENL